MSSLSKKKKKYSLHKNELVQKYCISVVIKIRWWCKLCLPYDDDLISTTSNTRCNYGEKVKQFLFHAFHYLCIAGLT